MYPAPSECTESSVDELSMRNVIIASLVYTGICGLEPATAQIGTAVVDCLCDNGDSFAGHRYGSPPFWLQWCHGYNGKKVLITASRACEHLGACAVRSVQGTIAITLQSCAENPNFIYKWSLQGPAAR